jgi:glycosyltransferase involved in cell wall biosynthesis
VSDLKNRILSVVHYTADVWEHVCPIVRVVAPLRHAGLRHVRGNEWEAGHLCVFPERVADGDIVVIQRDFPRYTDEYEKVIAQARALGKPVVYELDDLLTELPAQHPDWEFYSKARAAILQAVVEADAVIGSTPLLCDYLRGFNPNTWLLSNYLDDQLWLLDAPESLGASDECPVTIGYLGSPAHLPDLELIVPVLTRMLSRSESVRLVFWGMIPPVPLSEHPQVAWHIPALVNYAEFATYFTRQACDIFIAPLQDNLFNRCKSPLKFLEYSVKGIPGVYSCIAPYASVIEHGKNGFLASTLEEWEEYLVRLIETPGLRRRVGIAARQTVREQWLLSQHAGQWVETYRQICDVEKPQSSVAARVARQMHTWYRELAGQKDSFSARLQEKEQTVQCKKKNSQSLSAQLTDREQVVQSLGLELVAIKSSTGWSLLQVLWRLRLWCAPRGSFRERVLRLGMRGLRVWRREGLWSLARRATRKGLNKILRRPTLLHGESIPTQAILDFIAENGTRCPAPAISVVIVRDATISPLDEQAVANWLAAQTYQSVELVVWDCKSGVAWIAENPKSLWDARDIETLCAGLRGRYVCIASPDLLQQNKVYLEANLIALETESLVFTVNMLGNADWVKRHIEAKRLPGTSALPLLRQVVRKDCLRNNYTLDFSAQLAARGKLPVVVGKIIVHTVSQTDAEDTLPFETKLEGLGLCVVDQRIIATVENETLAGKIRHILHPVDSVLPVVPEPSPLPTVLVVMPFLAVGGAERVHLDVMQRLKDHFRFIIVTLEPFDSSLGTTADAFRQVTPYVYTIPDYLAMPLNFSMMTYLIERFQPRTLYIANGTTWIYNALCELRARFPRLRMVNQVYDHQAGWINRYEPVLVACLDAHIGANQRICQAYIARGAQPNRVYLIEHGVDPDEFNPARISREQQLSLKMQLGFNPEQKIVTFIGRLHPQKRPMDFVEIARRFKHDPSVGFLMIGDGPLAQTVENEIARIGLDNLVQRSFYSPSREIFAISDVIVLPSEYEGMPLVVLEAQIMGKPIVVTNVGNTREILEATGAGVLVANIGDITALANGVRKMLDTPVDTAQLRQTVINRFGIQNIVEKYRWVLLGESNA